MIKRWFPYLFSVVVLWFLLSRFRDVDWNTVGASLRTYSLLTLSIATFTSLTGFLFYASYDLLARMHIQHTLSKAKTLSIALCSYGFNLNLGAIIGGVGFRYRLYSKFGLKPVQVGQVFTFSIFTNWMGYTLLLGLCLLFGTTETATSLRVESVSMMTALGAVGPALAAAYLFLCFKFSGNVLKIKSNTLRVPSPGLALAQLSLALGNWLMMATTLYVLTAETGVQFYTLLLGILGAGLAGIIVRVPGGLGVQEAAFVTIVSHELSAPVALAAFFAYRGTYHFIPLLLCVLIYFVLESRAKNNNRHRS